MRVNFSKSALGRRLGQITFIILIIYLNDYIHNSPLGHLGHDMRKAIYADFTSMYHIYDPLKEFARFGIPDSDWRITAVNLNYEVSPTYPAFCAVPLNVDDMMLLQASKFRSKSRFDIFTKILFIFLFINSHSIIRY